MNPPVTPSSNSKNSGGMVIVSAPSGAGKSTLCDRLLAEFPNDLELSISSTSRKPRGQEQDGKHYHFIEKDEFERRIREGNFAEFAEVHGNFYGTSKSVLESAWAAGKISLLDIDVKGAYALRATYPNSSLLIFIHPPSMEELERRLRARGTESEEKIRQRLQNAKEEMSHSDAFDFVVVNDDLEKTFIQLKKVVTQFIDETREKNVSAEGGGQS